MINFYCWDYGITDLVTEFAESDSKRIMPAESDCKRLRNTIQEFKPKVAILLHKKATRADLKYLGKPMMSANHGQIGKIIENCSTMLYAVAFPHGNNIPPKDKIDTHNCSRFVFRRRNNLMIFTYLPHSLHAELAINSLQV